jgi:plasmid stability protein
VATLNIKDFPEGLYDLLKARAGRERRSVAQEVIRLLEVAVEEPEPLSILELRGLGKVHWQGIDAGRYVDEERSGWGS